jgi:hypothetical protein
MNTLEIDTLLKKHSHSKPVFKGVYARNRLPRLLNVPSALVGNTDPDHRMGQHWVAIYIDANSRGEYYDPTGTPPFFKGLRELYEQTLYELDLQYRSSTSKKKDLPCADIIAFFTSFIDVQDIA